MLTKRYLVSVKNLPQILQQIQKGTAPDVFDHNHLKSLGFTSSNDRGVIPLLKDLGFLNENGSPTERYRLFRSSQDGPRVLGEALLEAYGDLFHVSANPTEQDRGAIEGKFKATHNVTDRVAQLQAATFYALLKNADLKAARKEPSQKIRPTDEAEHSDTDFHENTTPDQKLKQAFAIPLRYNIEIHLPATKDIEVYHAIFRSIRENLGE